MRVLLISHTCQSITEGQPKAHALAAMEDITLRVLVPDRWHRYGQWRRAQAPDGATFEYVVGKVRLPWAGPAQSFLHTYTAMEDILREFKPDVIDLWEEPWSRVSVQACKLRDRVAPGAKIISETEQNIFKKLPYPFEGYRKFTLAHADFVLGRSNEAMEVIRRKGYAGPAETVPNAVDEKLFMPMDREACRRELELTGFVVGYAGRLVEEKGLLDLQDAVAQCPADVNLLIAGDGPLRERMAGRVKVLAGLPLAKLPPLMNAMDVLALPSRTTKRWKEQFGRVLIEANACGTPVIGTDSGAIAGVVGAGGLVVPECDPAALAAAIMQLRDDPRKRRELGEAGRRQVMEKYTWERVAARMHDIYRRVVQA